MLQTGSQKSLTNNFDFCKLENTFFLQLDYEKCYQTLKIGYETKIKK